MPLPRLLNFLMGCNAKTLKTKMRWIEMEQKLKGFLLILCETKRMNNEEGYKFSKLQVLKKFNQSG